MYRTHFRGSGFGLFGLLSWGGSGFSSGSSGGPGFGLPGSQAMDPCHFLEAFQLFVGAVIGAITGIGDALEAFEGGRAGGEGIARSAGHGGVEIFYDEEAAGALPELGLDAANATEAPFVMDERVDEEALVGIGGAVVFVVFGGELGEIFGFFVEHDLVNGVDAVLEGVEAGNGFACGGAWSG
jgi:hypothetical protein